MLHTTLKESVKDLPIESIEIKDLPKADYYALGHIHIKFEKEHEGKPVIYGGPTFPNNFKELEDLKYGSFYIIEVEGYTKISRKEIKLKEVELIEIEILDALKGTEEILSVLQKRELKDKIILLKVFGNLRQGKTSDIKFQEIDDYMKKAGAYSFLKNTSKLEPEKQKMDIDLPYAEMEKVEEVLIRRYEKENPSTFNELIFPLLEGLSLEKQEGEKQTSFESRLYSELSKTIGLELI
jgi:DNA repair exonuclease SbcCD nuclease subunit